MHSIGGGAAQDSKDREKIAAYHSLYDEYIKRPVVLATGLFQLRCYN